MTGVVEQTVTVEQRSVLIADVETSPLVAFAWPSTKPQYIQHDRIIHDPFMFCWAAQYRGQKKVHTAKLTPEEVAAKDDSRIVDELAELVRTADLVLAHNSDRFDVPTINNSLAVHGLEPMGPVQTIDTLKLAKKSFRFSHNNLDYLLRRFGLGSKIKTDFDLWRRCYFGDETAMQQMLRYCRNDVTKLADLFEVIIPYVKGLPRLVRTDGLVCPTCGSPDVQKRGYKETNASVFHQLYCKQCKRYSRVPSSEPQYRGGLRPL